MTNAAKKPQPKNFTSRAGILLLGLAVYVSMTGRSDDAKIKGTAQKALKLADEDAKHIGSNAGNMKKVLAAQQAAMALLGECDGPAPSGTQQMFNVLVEDYRGGPRTVDLGGSQIENKKTALETWLRTAAYVIWTKRTDLRDELMRDARDLLGISSRKALADLVSSMHRRQVDGRAEHEAQVKELFDAGWTSLRDFC